MQFSDVAEILIKVKVICVTGKLPYSAVGQDHILNLGPDRLEGTP